MISKLQRISVSALLMGILAVLCHPTFVNAAWQQPPHQFPGIGIGDGPPIASDDSGHAFALPGNFPSIGASYFSEGVWSDPPTVIGTASASSIDVAMDNGGTAVGIWFDSVAGTVETARFDGASWSTPNPDPLDTLSPSDFVTVAISMNGPNQAAAMWVDDNTSTVSSSVLISGSWSMVTPIGTGNTNPSIAYSANNSIVTGWLDTAAGTTVNNFTGGIWQGPVVLDPTGSNPVVGIDADGNALAVWTTSAGAVVYSAFNGSSWSVPLVISGTAGNSQVSLGMTPSGTAVATWMTGTFAGFSSSYNGISWSTPIQITPGPIGTGFNRFLSLDVADNGNALAVWTITASPLEIRSSRLPLGGNVWGPEEFVASVSRDITSLHASLSEDGIGFASWALVEIPVQFATASLRTAPPTNLHGSTCTNKFVTQSDHVNIITWLPSSDPAVVVYNLYRNGDLIATIPAQGPYAYFDHNRCTRIEDTYTLIAVDVNGVESVPVSITM
jgi:hypothetical protein